MDKTKKDDIDDNENIEPTEIEKLKVQLSTEKENSKKALLNAKEDFAKKAKTDADKSKAEKEKAKLLKGKDDSEKITFLNGEIEKNKNTIETYKIELENANKLHESFKLDESVKVIARNSGLNDFQANLFVKSIEETDKSADEKDLQIKVKDFMKSANIGENVDAGVPADSSIRTNPVDVSNVANKGKNGNVFSVGVGNGIF